MSLGQRTLVGIRVFLEGLVVGEILDEVSGKE